MPDQRLVGTFVSDRGATVEFLQRTGKFTEQQIEAFSEVLGKWKIEYDGSKVAATFDGEIMEKIPVKVLEKNDEYVVVETQSNGEVSRAKIIFTEDGYWEVSETAGPYYREKFRRIAKPTAKTEQKK